MSEMSRSPANGNESTPIISSDIVALQHSWCHKAARDIINRNTGLLLIIMSQFFFSSVNLAVKKLNSLDPPVSTMQLIAARMAISYLCSVLYMFATGVQDPILGPSGVRLLLLFRGFSGFIGIFGIYFSLQYLSLSDATVLIFLTPICTVFTGAIFLAESFSFRQILAGTISLIGVILIARPPFLFGPDISYPSNGNSSLGDAQKHTPTERLIAVGVALVGVFGTTAALTVIRAIGRRAQALHLMAFFSSICVLNSTISMIVMRIPVVTPTRWEWIFLLCLICICGFIAQVFVTIGLRYETVGRGAMAMYTQVVFALIFEFVFFHGAPSTLSIIGTILIIASALSVVLTKEELKPRTQDLPFRSGDDLETGTDGSIDEVDEPRHELTK